MSTFNDILDRMREIHDAKSRDYAGGTEFGNFSEAERVGVSGSLGAFIRLQDKYTRCCNLLSGAKAQVKDESVEDTLIDLANYAIIVLCLRRAEKEDQAETDELFLRAAAKNWYRDDDDPDIDDTTGESLEGNPVYEPPNCCPDRDQAAPDSLSLKQIRKKDSEWLEKLRIQLAELEKQQAKQPSLADLVDWDEAFAEEIYAIQMEDGDIWVCERYCVSSKGHYRPKGLHHLHKRNAPLAHDWQTPLRRPVPNANVCPHCGELTDFKECDCQRMKEDEAFEFLAMRQQWHDPTPSDMPSGGANG